MRWVFENLNAGHILSQKAQPKRDFARHAKAPSESFGRVLTEVVVEPEIAVDGSK
jgi:hypothetical protein